MTLTPKQKKYVKNRFNGMSRTEAAKDAYNCKDKNARIIGYELDHNKALAPQLYLIAQKMGYDLSDALEKLITLTNSKNESIRLKAVNDALEWFAGKEQKITTKQELTQEQEQLIQKGITEARKQYYN